MAGRPPGDSNTGARVVALYRRGVRPLEIAERLGLNQSTVYDHLARRVGSIPRLIDPRRTEAVAMREAGATLLAIADHFEVSQQTVHRWCRDTSRGPAARRVGSLTREQVVEMLDGGATMVLVAQRAGVTRQAVHEALKRWGLR